MIDPISVVCPNCNAYTGEACTAPDDYSRHPIKRVHLARIQAAVDAEHLAPDMSEVFERDAEVQAEAERRYGDSEYAYVEMAAFLAGAEWGSRPF